MPLLNRPDGEINYETFGGGFPVLLFAPGGLRSSMGFWSAPADGPPRPWVDWTKALPAAGFTAIAMDQRNAGGSRADVRADHGWHTYAGDHLALMEAVRSDRPAVAALLRRRGANPDSRNRAGESARDVAAGKDDPALQRALGP